MADHIDLYGNVRTRVTLPSGRTTFSADFVINDDGLGDPVLPHLAQHEVEDLPDEAC